MRCLVGVQFALQEQKLLPNIHKSSTMGWAQQISSFLAMAVHTRSDHTPSLPGDKLERAGSSPKSPALGVSVAVHPLSDHMPLLPGDNGHQVPPIHILRQAARQESSSSIGSSRGPSQEFVRVESSGPLARVSIDSQSINRMPSLPGDSVHQVHSMRYRRQAFKDASCN